MTRKFQSNPILSRVEQHLQDDERLLWVGQPSIKRMIARPTEGIDPLSILILGVLIAILMGIVLISGNSDSPLALSILLVVMLISAALIPTIGQVISARNTLYAITTYRAMIVEGQNVRSFGGGDITCMEQRAFNEELGDIIFKEITYERWIPNGYMPVPTQYVEEIGFFGIEQADYVKMTLIDALRNSPYSLWEKTHTEALHHKEQAPMPT